MASNELVAPVVKWVGGKRQLIQQIAPLIPKAYTTYCEPFLGGGAVLFHLQPKHAVVNDANSDLIELYVVIRDCVEELIESLGAHENIAEYFYEIRAIDRDKERYAALSPVDRASRLIYLNKTCYNGLFRVNNAGEFNTPFGAYKNPNIVNAVTLRAVSKYLRENDIVFSSGDFAQVLASLPEKSFVYFDPPYDPVSDSSAFTGYTSGGFGRDEQIRLRECCDELNERGIRFLLSNSDTEFIREQYSSYTIDTVQAARNINSRGDRRGNVSEVLVRNYRAPRKRQ